MITSNGCIKCDSCGKFVRIYWRYTPFGNALDLDPPNPVEYCENCYSNNERIINQVAWIYPYKVGEYNEN